jgi:DNA-binding CsgD family transcriptional regulator/MFS family permease
MFRQLLKPNVSSFGYALFLAINATSIWGGAFPLLPIEFQAFDLLTIFFVVESLTFLGMLLASMVAAWFLPQLTQKPLAVPCTFIMFLGSACLITLLYIPSLTMFLVIIGAVLLGIGCAAFFMLWQRVFASHEPERGNLDLMVGTGFSALIYALLHIIPIAIAAFIITFIFIPLSGLCLTLATRTTDFRQPMFEDLPRNNTHVYHKTIRFLWRSALCVGAFGFVSGVARAMTLEDPSMGLVVNLSSMAGALTSALILIALWRRYSFRFDTVLSFRTIFPLIVTSLLLLPFIGTAYLRLFTGAMYMFFMFAVMVMVIQCAQTSRDSGINPVFIYAFFGAIVYGLQSTGFLTGYLSAPFAGRGFAHLASIALFSVWFLAITLYLVRGQLRKEISATVTQMANIEFIALKTGGAPTGGTDSSDLDAAASLDATRDDDRHYRDRFAKQCAVVGRYFRLTARETEVMELIARGNSVAHIAEELVVSENTIRTHSKRLYVKLNVHKRQEIMDLLEEMG